MVENKSVPFFGFLYGEVELAFWDKSDGLPELRGVSPCFYYELSEFSTRDLL